MYIVLKSPCTIPGCSLIFNAKHHYEMCRYKNNQDLFKWRAISILGSTILGASYTQSWSFDCQTINFHYNSEKLILKMCWRMSFSAVVYIQEAPISSKGVSKNSKEVLYACMNASICLCVLRGSTTFRVKIFYVNLNYMHCLYSVA